MPTFKTANYFDQGLTIHLQLQSTSRAAASQVSLSKVPSHDHHFHPLHPGKNKTTEPNP